MTFKVHDGVEIDGKSLTNSGGTLSWGGVAVGSGGGVTISSNANNRVLTGDGSNAVGETNLTFDGTNLQIVGSSRGLITEKLRLGATDTSFIERDSTVNIGYRADGVHRFWTYNSSWLERAQLTDTGFNLLAGHTYQLGGTTVIDANRKITANERVIVSGSTNGYTTAPLVYFDSTSTANAGVRDWAIGPADDSYGNFHIFVGASTGADPVGNAGRVLTITNTGNATFAGSISSGAITASGTTNINAALTVKNAYNETKFIRNVDVASVGAAGHYLSIGALNSGSVVTPNVINGVTDTDGTSSSFALMQDGANSLSFNSSKNATFAGTISSGAITSTGNSVLTGSGSSGSAFIVKRGSNGDDAFTVQNTGDVLIQASYLYVVSTAGSYFQHAARFRGGISNDTSGVALTVSDDLNVDGVVQISGTTVIDTSRNLTNIGTISSGAVTSSSTFSSTISGNNTTGGNIVLGPSSGSSKWYAITGRQYDSGTETEGYSLITGAASSGVNDVVIGGGLDEQNAATKVMIKASANSTTRNGTEIVRVTTSGLDVRNNVIRITGTTVIDASRNLTATNATFTSSAGNFIIKHASTGNASVPWVQFKDGNNTNLGYVGYGSSGNSDLYIVNQGASNTGDIILYAGSQARLTVHNNGTLDSDGPIQINGTTVIDASRNLTNIGTGNFAGNVTIDYTGNSTNDAGLYVANDASDWGIYVNKDGSATYGLKIAADGDYALQITSSDGSEKFRVSGTGNVVTASDIQTSGGLIKFTSNNHVLTTNNTNNILLKSGNTGTMGLLGQNSGSQFRWQIYGDGSNYGFLDGNWANWDIQKAINGAFKVDEGAGLKRVLNEANWSSYISNNNQLTNGAGYITSSHTGFDSRYITKGGSWYGSNFPGSRWNGFSVNGGEIVFGRDNPNNGQMSILVDGAFYAGENNGFYSIYSGNNYNNKVGFNSNSSGHFLINTTNVKADGNTIWHAGNSAQFTSALNTKLAGIAASANNYTFPYSVSTGATASHIVQRDGNGYIIGNYLYMTGTFANAGAGGTMGYFTGTNGSDNYGRSWTAAQARTLLNVADGATNVTNTNQLTNGAGYITSSGTAANASQAGGLSVHSGRNNEANKIVRTDGNGYIQAGWINTTSGSTTTAISRIYASNDGYIRYYTPDAYLNSGGMGEKIFNNQDQSHGTSTNFNTNMPAGVHYMQQGTNGPTGTTSHQFYGIKFGLGGDYGTTSGGSDYASQMYYPRAAQSGGNGLYFRDMEGGSWGSWRQVDAGTLTGAAPSAGNSAIGASQIMKSHTNNYIFTNWINVGGQGIYSGTNGAHFYPNTGTTYGTWRINGARNAYTGIMLDAGGDVVIGMYDSSGNGGNYGEGTSGWEQYYHRANACLGITASTTSSSYSLYVTGAIYATGDIVGSSDERLKTEIKTIPNALDKVLQLRGVTYKWKEEEEAEENNVTPERMGVIAQEVLDIVPEVVTHDKENDRYGVSYGHLTGVLIEAIKELKQEINELKKELEEVKNG